MSFEYLPILKDLCLERTRHNSGNRSHFDAWFEKEYIANMPYISPYRTGYDAYPTPSRRRRPFRKICLLLIFIAGVVSIYLTKKYIIEELRLYQGIYNNVDYDIHTEGRPTDGFMAADYDAEGMRQRPLCDMYDLSKPMPTWYPCLLSNTNPAVFVCIYVTWVDKTVSYWLADKGHWENHLTDVMQTVFRRHPNIGFIDVGAHIGMHTLMAAAMGHKVVAVEPLPENQARLHKSIRMNGYEHMVKLVSNVISNKRKNVSLGYDKDRIGSAQVHDSDTLVEINNMRRNIEYINAQAVTMDDLLDPVTFTSAILKISIEGHECEALQTSKQLFKQIYIPYIFMKWPGIALGRDEWRRIKLKCNVQSMIDNLHSMGYTPYRVITNEELNKELWEVWGPLEWSIKVDIYWKHSSAEKIHMNKDFISNKVRDSLLQNQKLVETEVITENKDESIDPLKEYDPFDKNIDGNDQLDTNFQIPAPGLQLEELESLSDDAIGDDIMEMNEHKSLPDEDKRVIDVNRPDSILINRISNHDQKYNIQLSEKENAERMMNFDGKHIEFDDKGLDNIYTDLDNDNNPNDDILWHGKLINKNLAENQANQNAIKQPSDEINNMNDVNDDDYSDKEEDALVNDNEENDDKFNNINNLQYVNNDEEVNGQDTNLRDIKDNWEVDKYDEDNNQIDDEGNDMDDKENPRDEGNEDNLGDDDSETDYDNVDKVLDEDTIDDDDHDVYGNEDENGDDETENEGEEEEIQDEDEYEEDNLVNEPDTEYNANNDHVGDARNRLAEM
ncbi:unnamed protein product [Owenia fusiformis]|uniref:Uncharacterized protein n=1 Tax=Owenia fusiformis TaxID=6347 RepID=A0A8J1XMD8_OWEFU|nr:unnamed protein product [Owenia fusiformis]